MQNNDLDPSTLPEILYLPEEAAKKLRVTTRWLQLDRSTKRQVPYIKIGHFVRYRRSDVIKFLEKNIIGGQS